MNEVKTGLQKLDAWLKTQTTPVSDAARILIDNLLIEEDDTAKKSAQKIIAGFYSAFSLRIQDIPELKKMAILAAQEFVNLQKKDYPHPIMNSHWNKVRIQIDILEQRLNTEPNEG